MRSGPNLDKPPWTTVDPPHGPVEVQFLRQLALGETIEPFRLLTPVMAVIPLDGQTLLDSTAPGASGYRYLSAWLRDVESKWTAHCNKDVNGDPRMTLQQQIDYMRKLT